MFRKPTWCCWKSVGLADQLLFCAQAGLPRDPETWDPGRDWRSMILQHQLHTIETLRKILRKIEKVRKIGNSTSSEKWPCSSLLGFPNSSPVQTSTSETEHLSDISEIVNLHLLQCCGFGKFALQKASKRISAWSVLKMTNVHIFAPRVETEWKSPPQVVSCAARPGAWSMLDTWACRQEHAP